MWPNVYISTVAQHICLERPNSMRTDQADTLVCPHISPQMGIHWAYYDPCAKLTTHHDPAEWFGILPVTQPLRHRTGELSAKWTNQALMEHCIAWYTKQLHLYSQPTTHPGRDLMRSDAVISKATYYVHRSERGAMASLYHAHNHPRIRGHQHSYATTHSRIAYNVLLHVSKAFWRRKDW